MSKKVWPPLLYTLSLYFKSCPFLIGRRPRRTRRRQRPGSKSREENQVGKNIVINNNFLINIDYQK